MPRPTSSAGPRLRRIVLRPLAQPRQMQVGRLGPKDSVGQIVDRAVIADAHVDDLGAARFKHRATRGERSAVSSSTPS